MQKVVIMPFIRIKSVGSDGGDMWLCRIAGIWDMEKSDGEAKQSNFCSGVSSAFCISSHARILFPDGGFGNRPCCKLATFQFLI